MSFAVQVLAHQGGWDEALMALAPVALFVALLRAARARAADRDQATGDRPPDDSSRERHLVR